MKILRELSWILIAVALTIIPAFWMFGFTLFNGGTVDIQMHDTYYVIPKSLVIGSMFLIVIVSLVIIRLVYYFSNSKVINVIILLLLSVVLFLLIGYLDWISDVAYQLGVLYSREADKEISDHLMDSFRVTKVFLWTLMLVVSALALVTGFRLIFPRRLRL